MCPRCPGVIIVPVSGCLDLSGDLLVVKMFSLQMETVGAPPRPLEGNCSQCLFLKGVFCVRDSIAASQPCSFWDHMQHIKRINLFSLCDDISLCITVSPPLPSLSYLISPSLCRLIPRSLFCSSSPAARKSSPFRLKHH